MGVEIVGVRGQNDTATDENLDNVLQRETLIFIESSRVQSFNVTVNGDRTFEPTETFHVLFSDAEGATVLNDSALGLIDNDDPAVTAAASVLDVSNGSGALRVDAAAMDRLHGETRFCGAGVFV